MEKNTERTKKPVMPFFKTEITPSPALNMEREIAEKVFVGSSEAAKEFYLRDIERIEASMMINQAENSMIPKERKRTREI